jgi:hypothetical protein
MRRSFPSFPVAVLLLGRSSNGLSLVVSPPTVTLSPGASLSFSAAPGPGAADVTVTPASPTVAPGGAVTFAAGGS